MTRLGVIVGFTSPMTAEDAARLLPVLESRYPGVVFTLVDNAAGHLAFEFDEPDESAGPPPKVVFEPEAM